jgi:tetratricopeptide (TPR) repeat protein
MKDGNSKAFYAAISQTLRQYLGDKFSLPPAGITAEEIYRILRQYGLDEETADLLKNCLDECDFARFAPVIDTSGMEIMLQKAEKIVERIEKLKIQKSKTEKQEIKSMLLFALLSAFCFLPSAFCFAECSVEEVFLEANGLYEQGNYDKAIARYQAIVDSGIQNGIVYYNLGNALLKQQRIGEAILAYERAKRLSPRDDDVAFNLDYARALTLDKMEQWKSGKIITLLAGIRGFFTPDEVCGFFLAMYVCLIFLAIFFLFSSRRRRTRILYLSILPMICFLLSGVLLFAQISHRNADHEAILLVMKSEARTGPGEGYSTVFEIHEGAKVRIQREKQDWVEIKLPNKVIGWIMKKDLAQIYQHP